MDARRTGCGRIRRIAGGGRCPRRASNRVRAQLHRRSARQSRARLAGHLAEDRRQCARGRRDHQVGAACRARRRASPAHRHAPMETRGANARYDAATDSYTCASARRARARAQPDGADHGHEERETARHHRRCRRRFRHEDADLSGISGAAGRGEKARPSGVLDVEPLGSLHDRQPGRDAVTEGELAIDENGKFLALRMRHVPAMGAYIAPAGIGIRPTISPAVFRPCTTFRKSISASKCVFTNTLPIGPYRGAGRPEANYVIERAGRGSRAHHRHRPRGAAQAKPHSAIGDALQDRRSAPPSTAAISRHLGQGDGARRFDGFKQAQAQVGKRTASCAASAFPACSNMPAAADRRRVAYLSRRRQLSSA